jgi:acetyl-CoA synthetase
LIKASSNDEAVHPKSYDLSSLRLLGSVGEPINPEAWMWYYENVGGSRCPIADTFWQTETGGHMISPLPGATALKPGSATRPLFGIQPALVDAEGQELQGEAEGNLIIKDSWPGQMRTIWGDCFTATCWCPEPTRCSREFCALRKSRRGDRFKVIRLPPVGGIGRSSGP